MPARVPAAQNVARVQWSPWAECLSLTEQGIPCTWSCSESRDAIQRAKDHAKYSNHKVRTVAETVSIYRRPDYDDAIDQPEPEPDGRGGAIYPDVHEPKTRAHARTECSESKCGLPPKEVATGNEQDAKHA